MKEIMPNTSFLHWMRSATDDPDLIPELCALQKADDRAGIHDRFYRELEFGTGGLRGLLGAGDNRINIYTVRKATQGLANYLRSNPSLPQSVAIAYDSRIKGGLFAQETARVLAANEIEAHLYPRLQPTPALSWAVRYLGCGAGVCITASHNPAEYNGYKVYGADGAQITLETAEAIFSYIKRTDPFTVIAANFEASVESGKIRFIGEDCLDAYLHAVQECRLCNDELPPIKLVYTPLNGAGLECVTRILHAIGVKDVTVVPEQREPDGNFPTCPYPNPEIRESLQKGLELCQKLRPDLLIATDPDCDRIGVAVADGEEYRLLTGNEMGVLLFNYICERRIERGTMPKHPVAVTTIVSTDMATPIAAKYGVELRRVLTGFKFIGEQIGRLECEGQVERFVFGFEESYGYLSGTYVRDKDAVNATALACEMAAYYRKRGYTLAQAMDALYDEYGYYQNALCTFTFKGSRGAEEICERVKKIRRQSPESIGGLRVLEIEDYLDTGKTRLPAADALAFGLEGNVKVMIRPSGTEPQVKAYLFVVEKTQDLAKMRMDVLRDGVGVLLSKCGI